MTIKYITKHLFSIFSILIFLIIAFGSTDEEDMAKKETILRINPDTKEGKMVFDTIRKMNYNQMGVYYYIELYCPIHPNHVL